MQNYGPVVVPTKSSLYIKVSNVDNPILPDYTQFNINCFDDIDTDISETELPLLLNSHSYFDELVYPEAAMLPNHDPVWNWRHGELDETYYINAMNQISNWMYDISNRAITEIKGHVADNNISQITAKMYLNGNEYQDFMLDAQGNYCIPYLYTRDADIRLIFEKSGCLPTYRDISLRYADAMLHDYTVPNATMHAFDLNNLTVSNSGSGSFTSINSAMGFVYDYLASGLYNNEPIRIKLLAGTYDESVDLSPLAALGVTNFTLEGEGNPEIKGQITLNCEALSPLQAAGYKIKGIRFSDTALAILFRDSWDDNAEEAHAPHFKLTVENCHFQDCGSPDIQSQSSYGAAAIHFEGAGVINACTFTDNVLTASSSNYATNLKAGAIYVLNNSSDAVTISGCGFANNLGAVSGGLALSGTGAIKVKNNTFEHNLYSGFCATVFQNNRGNALSVFTCGNAEIQNNTFVDNFTSSYGGVVVYLENTSLNPQPLQPILFMNNTIHNNLPGQTGNVTSALSFKYQADPPITQDIIIRNNVFSCPTPTNGARVISVNGYSNPNLSHNILFNTLPEGFSISSDPVHPRFNYTCNPQLGSSFTPVWTQTTMSPCIDAGIGDNDPDGTPPDIGAKRAENHACWQYSFTNQADLEKWYWVSYPVLNRTTDLLKASEFFEELLKKYQDDNYVMHPIYLDEIDWIAGEDSYLNRILWSVNNWSDNQSTHYVSSPQGYKVKLLPRSNPSFPAVVTLDESGFKTSPYLPFNIYGGVENWLGYFKEEPSWPHEVFASIWEDINMIKTKSWCIVRANPLGDYWGMHGKVSTLKYGDMVVVTTNNDHTDFQWNNTNIIEDVAVATPVHFTFNEKQDYVPVYISLPDSLKIDLKEIGLYLDGVCKGAVVVENNLEQICAYLDIDEKLTDGVVEFVFYYNPDKSQVQECRTLRIDNSRFAAQYVNGNRRYPFYNITLSPKDLENVAPLEFALNQNYPNPFNPTTTISYQLPESGKVRLDVYNLKGQLVKTLIDGTQVSGLHSVVWNGTDTKNRSVASGVYLYRLSSQHNVQTKRMLLMK
ncbi:hypothetical protein MASR1M36_17160 [Candidatus Cloacimonadaceae bacterium]